MQLYGARTRRVVSTNRTARDERSRLGDERRNPRQWGVRQERVTLHPLLTPMSPFSRFRAPAPRGLTRCVAALSAAVLHATPVYAQPTANDPRAVAIIDQAVTRMGGEPALRGITSLRLDVMTMWQRTGFAVHPYADAPSFERNVELRDYANRAWRNTRFFLPSPAGSVDIVRDTIGARTLSGPNGQSTASPLNLAYVDERREQFAFAPERTLLLARDAGGLRLLPDTAIDGVAHARLAGRVDGFEATWFVRRTDHLPAFVRFMADETNDFGLAGWGVMEVETWWSQWARVAPGVLIPRQRDVRRVGRPYKRMTVLSMAVNAPAPADSFAIADSLVTKYLASERRPMWAVGMDTVRFTDSTFVTLPPWLGSAGAVRVGGTYVLIETAQADSAAGLTHAFLRAKTGIGAGVGIVSRVTPGNGGAGWFARNSKPVYVAPGARRLVQHMVRGAAATRPVTITRAQWVKVGTDSLWLEPVDLPDGAGTLTVYAPTLQWLYSPLNGVPTFSAEHDALIARLEKRGLSVKWLGSARALRAARP